MFVLSKEMPVVVANKMPIAFALPCAHRSLVDIVTSLGLSSKCVFSPGLKTVVYTDRRA